MAPRRRSNTGFIGVRLRPAGHFAAEITAGGTRVWLGTFYTKEAAARAYDVAAWRFGRPRHEMNFPEVRDHPGDEATRAFWKEKQTYGREEGGKRQRKAEVEAEYAKGEASTWGRMMNGGCGTSQPPQDTPSEDEDFDFSD
ncbi:hypothetical protein QYE76_047536 [Lolium multiflorum]|uniref:AP2/ERF domain-containing protein n=1 Tax=Lolium multiflorum TaxID=4521 RepID=A0AAD8X225_LOLMU|nr:hypothetical protein QYE76_047536 [Lolium multiflorum]